MLHENTHELAENKLLLLYVLNKINLPISNNRLTQIILENNFINYFILQQYITELNSSNFIKYSEQDGKQRIVITDKGIKVLSLFKNRISESKISSIDTYLLRNLPAIKKELTVSADYTIEKNNSFMVEMKVIENDTALIELKLNVPTQKHAETLCKKWNSHSSEVYNSIIDLLLGD